MYREASVFLKDWKQRTTRKPLIIRGARQTGKTYLVEEFSKEFETFIKINFEENIEYKDFFITNKVSEILENISLTIGKPILPGKTLLFIDELQACPEAIPTLRYFYENIPGLHIIAAGSLLDHVLADFEYSMPVGRVEFLYLFPMNFKEFIKALGEDILVEFLDNFQLETSISSPVHNKLLKLLRTYYFIGGMPEAIKTYIETSNLLEVERVHESILAAMEIDFSKYRKMSNPDHLRLVLRYTPRGLGKKFKYVNVSSSIKSEALKTAFQKLQLSRIVHRVSATSAAKLPLASYEKENFFKPLFLDIGLSCHLLKIRLLELDNLMLNNIGDMAEQFVGQQLLTIKPFFIDQKLYYWTREKSDSNAELDYLFEIAYKAVPIEVKAGKTGTLKSLHVFMYENQNRFAIRFNTDLPSLTNVSTSIKMKNSTQAVSYKLLSLPLYLVNFIDHLPIIKD